MKRSAARPSPSTGLVALWTQSHDVTDSVVQFLETEAIATLPLIAKALRKEQQRVLFAAARRAGALAACTNAFLTALKNSGREFDYRETWQNGLHGWTSIRSTPIAVVTAPGDPSCVEIVGTPTPDLAGLAGHFSGMEKGFGRSGLAVTRFRVCASISGIWPQDPNDPIGHIAAGGYALLCGPSARGQLATDDFIGGIFFTNNGTSSVALKWLYSDYETRSRCVIYDDVVEGEFYVVDATFHFDREEVDISVNGRHAATLNYLPRPLDSIRLYNFSDCSSRFREVAVSREPRPHGPAAAAQETVI
mmetsp:Transcript_2662/g.7976  ORF Transcript_2662/g.7976 Transcript_2662/m.7976 type:complete len:305 (+) Transcript_2662:109-1023(+)